MYTILMLNQKGGVGKTTIADELSFALERRGKTVAFVTTDPQGGSVHEVCNDPDFAEECDFQVVDTAGVLVGGVNDWCRAANLILVPMLPSTRDMEPTLRTLDIVRESGTGAKAYVIVNNFYAYVSFLTPISSKAFFAAWWSRISSSCSSLNFLE